MLDVDVEKYLFHIFEEFFYRSYLLLKGSTNTYDYSKRWFSNIVPFVFQSSLYIKLILFHIMSFLMSIFARYTWINAPITTFTWSLVHKFNSSLKSLLIMYLKIFCDILIFQRVLFALKSMLRKCWTWSYVHSLKYVVLNGKRLE